MLRIMKEVQQKGKKKTNQIALLFLKRVIAKINAKVNLLSMKQIKLANAKNYKECHQNLLRVMKKIMSAT